MSRGFLFSLDALLASLILIGGLILVGNIAEQETNTAQLTTASEDTIVALQSVKIYDMEDPWIQEQVENGTISDANASALEQIGFFWAVGKDDEARQLAELLLEASYPGFGVRLTFDDARVYERNLTGTTENVLVANRLVSGIAQGEAIRGSSASAYLRRVRDKRTNAFSTFGGFVGQGNVSLRFLDLPSDSNVTQMTMELAVGAPFTVFLNGASCGGTYTPLFTNGTPTSWDISECNASLLPGATNTIEIQFSQPLNESYIAGGFLRIKYKTEQLNENVSTSFSQIFLPGIDGIVNLFDSFFVPGTLENMTIYLHYNATNSTYLQIGEKRVWEDQGEGIEKTVTLNDSFLRDPLQGKLDYDFLSNKTIPLRLAGFMQLADVVSTGNADVVVITDFSGSMKKAVLDWEQGNLGSDCDNAYADATVRRTLLAECVDKVLVDGIMNFSGNRIWPVFLHDNQAKWYNNPEDQSAIEGYIGSFSNGKDKTCYACAFNRAYDIFSTFSNESRKKFIVFMSDGVPTHCASGSCTSTSTSYGDQQCEGLCDTAGACDESDIPAQCSECTTNNGGQLNAYSAASRSVDDFNATIFTVGFGPVSSCSLATETLQELASIGNGTYQHSNDSTEIKLIYENITQEIISRTDLVSQTVLVDGNISFSQLFDDSHINITFDLAEQYEEKVNTLAITLQSQQGCNPVVEVFPEQRVIEAKTISYSGVHWTDRVLVNGNVVFNLSSFLKPYAELGDPTVVYAPISLFSEGNNTVLIETGDSPVNRTGCSSNNSVIYTSLINLSTERSTVVPDAEGCVWRIQFEDDTFQNITLPASYSGTNTCSYTASNVSYNPSDAYQLGTYEILQRLDFRKNGKLFVNLREEDLEIVVTTISGVPYMWGPVAAKLEVSK